MPRGAYTAKQDRKAKHIEEGYEKRGVSKKEAESRAWATINKQDKGGKNAGHGPFDEPQRRSQEGLGNPPPEQEGLEPAFEDFDRAFQRAQLAVRQPFELRSERGTPAIAFAELIAARFGQPQRKPAAVVRVLRALDKAGANQRVDRAADRRRAAPDALATSLSVAGSLAPIADSSLRRARSAARPGRPRPILRDGAEPRRQGRR